MPNALVQKIARVSGHSTANVEGKWDTMKKSVEAQGISKKDPRYYKYIVGRLKKTMSKKQLKKAGWKSKGSKKREDFNEFHIVDTDRHGRDIIDLDPHEIRHMRVHEDPLLSHIPNIQQVHDMGNAEPERHSLAQRVLQRLSPDHQDEPQPSHTFNPLGRGYYDPNMEDPELLHHIHPELLKNIRQRLVHRMMGAQAPEYGTQSDYLEWLAQQFKEQNPTLLGKLKRAMKDRDYKFLLGKLAIGAFWGAALIASPILIGGGLLLQHKLRTDKARQEYIRSQLYQ